MASEKRNPKLHEIIAVKANLRTQMVKTMGDLQNTFEKKSHLFTGKVKTFTPKGENAESKTEEALDIQTSVMKELSWVSGFIAKAMDISYHATLGDTHAKGDIVLEDGTQIASGIPSITLLELEDRLEEIRKFAMTIPTLDPAKNFKPDPDKGANIYVAREIERERTQATKEVLLKAAATEKHPAQTEVYDVQRPIGWLREKEWSAMLTPAEKGDIIGRIEMMTRAVKKARSRANETEVDVTPKIGETLVNYCFFGS